MPFNQLCPVRSLSRREAIIEVGQNRHQFGSAANHDVRSSFSQSLFGRLNYVLLFLFGERLKLFFG